MTPALAQDAACPPMVVEADSSVTSRWPGLPGSVRDAFAARDDVDRCARIILTLRHGIIGLEVTLPDGRSAHRSASRREDVIPALEALLLVPHSSPDASESIPPPSAPPTSAPPTTSAPIASPPDATLAPPAPAPEGEAPAAMARPSTHLRIELSVGTGARVGDGQASVGLGALSFLDISGWLVGFAGRVDRYEMLTGAHSGGALELALLGGRRFRFGSMALDLAAGPAAALQGTTDYTVRSGTGPQPKTIASESAENTVPRLLLEARLGFGALSTLHTFVAIDGDFGPASSPDASQIPGAPRLPIWTLGLALGVTVGTQ